MSGRRRLPDLGIEPLTARSLALSALLGTHPPRLPVRALVALGSVFGIAEGTMRTALSRMLTSGEVESDGGHYLLGERMRHRQEVQDEGRHVPDEPWDGSWWLVIVDADRRPIAQRRAFRARIREHRMGELRPDVWLRPANIAGPALDDEVLGVRGEIGTRDPMDVTRQLWDLDSIAHDGRALAELAEEALAWLEPGDPAVLADTFLVSVAAVRFLRTEPLLPRSLVGVGWPPDSLRATYDRLEAAHRSALAAFLSTASRAGDAADYIS